MSSLKSGILLQNTAPEKTGNVASTENIGTVESTTQDPTHCTSTSYKREIEMDNFLTVIRKAKEKADTVSESDVWGL